MAMVPTRRCSSDWICGYHVGVGVRVRLPQSRGNVVQLAGGHFLSGAGPEPANDADAVVIPAIRETGLRRRSLPKRPNHVVVSQQVVTESGREDADDFSRDVTEIHDATYDVLVRVESAPPQPIADQHHRRGTDTILVRPERTGRWPAERRESRKTPA